MPLPNLIIIGAMKCGTTSLHRYLNYHSEIFMSKIKELDFFIQSRNYVNGIAWYKQQFSNKHQINGEASQNYTKREIDDKVAKRIYDTIPHVKLVYLVRDPLTRIESHFKDLKTYGYIEPDRNINDVVREDPKFPIFMTSHYYHQISPYLDLFSRKQILFVKSDRLSNNTLVVMNEIFDFLNLSPWKELPFGDEKLNSSASKTVERPLIKYIRSTRLFSKVKRLISPKLSAKLVSLSNPLISTSLDSGSNRLSSESILILKETMKDDLAKFYNVSGISY